MGVAAEAARAEAWVLTTDLGARLLEEIAQIEAFGPSELGRLRKLAAPPAVAAAIRLCFARAKARGKFEHGDRLWVDLTGVEQATSELVARHKAARFNCPLVVDLCAGVGGDALALAGRSDVLAVDLDFGMCHRLEYNAAVYGVAGRVLPVRARAEAFAIPSDAWLHLDPDRRVLPRGRARLLHDYAPGPDFWRKAAQRVAAGAIKLSPASDFAKHFSDSEHEIELVSLRGECKEATLWFGELVSCRRRATRLPENVTWTDRDGPTTEWAPVAPLATWIYDPDPALLRAGLLDGFARAHQLNRVGEGVHYLTGGRLVSTPFLTPFEIQEVSALDLKRLRRVIARNEIGTLEIKVRGVDIAPEVLRARLQPRGARSATLLVIGGSGAARAVLAHRTSTGGSTALSSTGAACARDSTGGATPSPLPSGSSPAGAAGARDSTGAAAPFPSATGRALTSGRGRVSNRCFTPSSQGSSGTP
jgi:hypothetical protein